MPRPAVFVSGLPRSGTSLIMQLTQACGIAPLCDEKRTPDEHNPEGYFELEAVRHLATHEGIPPWYPRIEEHVVKVIAPLITCVEGDGAWLVLYAERPLKAILTSQKRMLNDPTSHSPAEIRALRDAQEYTLSWLSERPHTQVLRIATPTLMGTEAPKTVQRIAHFLRPAIPVTERRDPTETMLRVIRPELFNR